MLCCFSKKYKTHIVQIEEKPTYRYYNTCIPVHEGINIIYTKVIQITYFLGCNNKPEIKYKSEFDKQIY